MNVYLLTYFLGHHYLSVINRLYHFHEQDDTATAMMNIDFILTLIRMTFGVCVSVCVCVRGISPSITGRILMKLRMDIPVHHAQCV